MSNDVLPDDHDDAKIDDQIGYHKEMEEMAAGLGDFTKVEHHRKMQEIFIALKEKQLQQEQEQSHKYVEKTSHGRNHKISSPNADNAEILTPANGGSNHSFPDWRGLYADRAQVESLPWFSKELDSDLRQELDNRKIKKGRFLDLGTGPATQAIKLSELGFDVTATDISDTAIARARTLSIKIKFVLDDILNSKLPDNQFDYIFDRGCFHTLDPSSRHHYIHKVWSLLTAQGLLFLKTFSIKEPMSSGPYRFSIEMIKELFGADFEILASKETVFQGTLQVLPKALFTVMMKRWHQ
jgi:SAM-dependent methyltransferase